MTHRKVLLAALVVCVFSVVLVWLALQQQRGPEAKDINSVEVTHEGRVYICFTNFQQSMSCVPK